MRYPKFRRFNHNVAVIGLYRSGKTVFLTSLINHLKHHRPSQLKLGKGDVKLTVDCELEVNSGFDRLPYERYRSSLVDSKDWPKKTKTISQYCCRYFRSDWKWTKGQLTLTDIPGERLPDIPMAGFSYDQWSDWLSDRVFVNKEYSPLVKDFVSLAERIEVKEEPLVMAYRQTLALLYRNFRPVITPSTFILTEDNPEDGTEGSRFVGANALNGDISGCYSGLSMGSQFVPLSSSARKRHPDLAATFSKRYTEYQRKVAKPCEYVLRKSNQLVVLIDVTTLLASTTGMFNGCQSILDELLQLLCPGFGLFGVTLDVLGNTVSGGRLGIGGIDRLAFVATKADKVNDSCRENLRLLVTEMCSDIVERYVENSSRLDVNYFACSAVKSTRSTPNGHLQGTLEDSPNARSEYSTSVVPKRWPAAWDRGHYVFPDVKPYMPPNQSYPPDHIDLNMVIDFLMQ